ncbi:MAG: hypothetical protein ACK5XN_36070, partial [Bacteroidota bacterium]
AYLIGAHEGDVCAVLSAFEHRGLTNCGTVVKWRERQHGTSAARMAEKRKRERSEDVTHSDAHSVNVRTVTPTIQDKTIHDITLQDRKKDIDGDSLIRRASREKQATRYPEDFAPEENQDIPPEVVAREGPKFADYWRGVPGARGRKLDWQATWRNWCRKAMENGPNAKPRNNHRFDASSPEAVRERRAQIAEGLGLGVPGHGRADNRGSGEDAF